MDFFDGILVAAFLALISFQSWLTYRVFRSTVFERKQKMLQAQLIWLVPIIGAGLVFTVLQEEERAMNNKTPPSAMS